MDPIRSLDLAFLVFSQFQKVAGHLISPRCLRVPGETSGFNCLQIGLKLRKGRASGGSRTMKNSGAKDSPGFVCSASPIAMCPSAVSMCVFALLLHYFTNI